MSGEETARNLMTAYTAESKAAVRNRVFAEIADKEGYTQIGRLFRAVAEAESVHARNALKLMGKTKSTEENLQYAFENEIKAKNEHYPDMVREAEAEGDSAASLVFSRTRDVEERHGMLYRSALDSLVNEKETDYFVCQVCGFVAETSIPDPCPICQAGPEKFTKVD